MTVAPGPPRRGHLRLLVPLALMAAIFVESSRQLPIELAHGSDKVAHFLAFGALAALWVWALEPRRWGLVVLAVLALAVTSVWGALDEYHQFFVPGRSCDVLDWVADTAGAAAAVAVMPRALRRRREA